MATVVDMQKRGRLVKFGPFCRHRRPASTKLNELIRKEYSVYGIQINIPLVKSFMTNRAFCAKLDVRLEIVNLLLFLEGITTRMMYRREQEPTRI